MELLKVEKDKWLRKKMKRELKKKDKGIVELMMIMRHFFKDLSNWIDDMADPRHPSYIVYTQTDLIYMGILKNICGVKTMRTMEEKFNKEECINTLRILSGDDKLDEMPHSDTLNYYLTKLSPKCLADLRKKMIKRLLSMKSFYSNRLLGKYWRVIIDGTGLFYFKEKHCNNCLVQTIKIDDTTKVNAYYHKVLEAKLVLGEKVVISIDTEFIENENENVSKQDCEITAAKRLLKRLAKDYPRLPICIQGDNLYSAETIMEMCREKGWKYIFTHKGSRQQLLEEGYQWIQEGEGVNVKKNIGEYVNHVEEVAGKREVANIFKTKENVIDKKTGKEKEVTFSWITDIELTNKNLEEMITAARGRWKIENEGFNNQKNGIYDIEHLNSKDTNAMKNHYLLTQVADIIMQIYLAWNPIRKEIKESIKNTSSWLLECFRRQIVTDEDVLYIQRYTTIYLE